MKRIIVLIAATFLIGISAVFAGNTTPEKVKENFRKEFPGASLVLWGEENGYFKVWFLLNNVRTMAFFDKDGELQGSINNLFFDQLPMAVRTSFNKRFIDAVILEIYEITNPENIRYKFVLESKEKTYTAILYHEGTIDKVQKDKE